MHRSAWAMAVLCLAAIVVSCSPSASAPPGSSAPAGDNLATLPTRMAPDGVAIEVGNANAPKTVMVYEDFQCPCCARFERVNGPELATRAAAGSIKVRYVIASLLDDKLGGESSARAANAARASVEIGGFPAYHRWLFDHQPVEGSDGFTTEFLLGAAGSIPALNSPAFGDAVRATNYQQWVTASQLAYLTAQRAHPDGVPTVLIGSIDANAALYDKRAFTTLLDR
ncbi:thioredoxin domain-containing protein [Mycobacterium haemophilum]|nr:thioredoxin domain-containing protein [Mycobacterium haemophilum]